MARMNPPECELENIVVAEAHRRQGIASQLLTYLITAARERRVEKILLEVRESNVGAGCFYRKVGFIETGRRKAYYRDPAEDALLLTFSI